MDQMSETIKEYFKDFFEDIKFYYSNDPVLPALAFDGKRNGNLYNFTLSRNMYDGAMLHHWMENIKGDIVKGEQTILLEKK